jgi:glycosyltransferase involved in cell wall biosynthesis
MVGPFPPPVHGMSMVNDAVRGQILLHHVDLQVLDLSAKTLNRSLRARLSRLPKFIMGLTRYLWMLLKKQNDILYISISSGYGQLYEILFIFAARVFSKRIVMHHHGFAYLNEPNPWTGALFRVAGPNGLHVTLCEDMAQKLSKYYPQAGRSLRVSNASLVRLPSLSKNATRNSLRTLGFLSNISYEKGIIEFMDVMKRLGDDGIEVNGLIAGPFQDTALEVIVQKRVKGLKCVKYVGPKYGTGKTKFFETIDLLLFPTRNEAEPLTIYEAMCSGIPVIARDQGCIRSMISDREGMVIGRDMDFVKEAVDQIASWYLSPESFQEASRKALRRSSSAEQMSTKSLNAFLDALFSY